MKSALILALAPSLLFASACYAADKETEFFSNARGNWVGPGEIVAGKFKGTKFVCTFVGTTPDKKMGLTLDGGCRVGMFTQKMTATVEKDGKASYKGKFQDGAKGEGLDIVSGSVVDKTKMVLGINRNQLKGAMLAKISDPDTMTVTVSVRVEKELVPVIGMSLKRVDEVATSSVPE